MSLGSAIEWTDATWNPVTGCTKISPGCKYCYAERLMERFGIQKFTEIAMHPDRLELPLHWRGRRLIFVNSMSDLFHEAVPFNFIDQVFDVMSRARHHTFQVLTKRPERLLSWCRERHNSQSLPPNVWLGVSVESLRYTWRIDRLREVEARTRFISAEPLLGPLSQLDLHGIAWLITGGESGGPPARALVTRADGRWRPKADALRWVRELRDQCCEAGVAFFHKQWGGPTAKSGGRLLDGKEWAQYPAVSDSQPTAAAGIR